MKKIIIIFSLMLSILFPQLTEAENSTTIQDSVVETSEAISTLDEIKEILKEGYYKSLSEDVLNSASIEELLNKLNDPYTDYMSKEEFDSFLEKINQNYSGIGITLEKTKDAIFITNVNKNGPADKMGLENGDIILKVNNSILKMDMSLEEIQSCFLGEENTDITVTVKRGKKELTFSGKRKPIHIPLVESKLLDGNVGYIKIGSFGEDTYDEFLTHLKSLNKKNATKWIIDLRNNGGGYVDPALHIMEHLIHDTKNPVLKFVFQSDEAHFYVEKSDLPLNSSIILTNEYTASASEILTFAAKTKHAATVMGTKTFGKGITQSSVMLSDKSVFKFTDAEIKSMKDESYNKVGISPNVELSKMFPINKSSSDQWLSFARLYQQNHKGKASLNDLRVNLDSNKKLVISNYPLLTNDLKDIIRSLIKQNKVEIYTKTGWKAATSKNLLNIAVKMYGVGNGLYLSESNSIKYEVPSKKMIVESQKGKKVRWGKTYLKKGQIGRATILSTTPVYKLDSHGKYILQSKSLKAGTQYPVYALKKYSK